LKASTFDYVHFIRSNSRRAPARAADEKAVGVEHALFAAQRTLEVGQHGRGIIRATHWRDRF
jgi:hypothetical protein